MRCYKCNSLSHIKWNCQLYVCPLCRQRQLGHTQKNCSDCYHNDGIQGHFDIGGEETSNYSRECWNPAIIMYSFQNWMVWLCSFFLPFSPFFHLSFINMFPIAFTQTFDFLQPTSGLEPVITLSFEKFYPPPILTKHLIWYYPDANFFITLCGILYGLHWWYFDTSILFQEIVTQGELHLVGLIPNHPIPFDNLKHNLFHNFLILLYHGTIKLNHLTKNDWVNIKWLCVDWYLPHQTAIVIRQFCKLWHWQLPPMHQFLLQFFTVHQISRCQNLEERQWRWIHIKESDNHQDVLVENDFT